MSSNAQEAEGVPAGTAEPLVWQEHRQPAQLTEEVHRGFQARPSEHTEYLIHDYTVAWLVSFMNRESRDCDFPSFEIHSEAAAKAACERHYATGKWG